MKTPNKKSELKKKISEYIQANINRHYQYLLSSNIPMDSFNKKFVPALLKELNEDIMRIIDEVIK